MKTRLCALVADHHRADAQQVVIKEFKLVMFSNTDESYRVRYTLNSNGSAAKIRSLVVGWDRVKPSLTWSFTVKEWSAYNTNRIPRRPRRRAVTAR